MLLLSPLRELLRVSDEVGILIVGDLLALVLVLRSFLGVLVRLGVVCLGKGRLLLLNILQIMLLILAAH